jgi:hypothetical protein
LTLDERLKRRMLISRRLSKPGEHKAGDISWMTSVRARTWGSSTPDKSALAPWIAAR